LATKPVDVCENGLKVSVMGESGVLSMTSVLPVAALVLPELPLPLEPPQAAIPIARTLATARLFRTVCLIA
jgi:hypothetical protein